MPTEPELVQLLDFLCEHTPSKSRLLALVGAPGNSRSLAAVLTCKDQDHAYQAQDLLRRILALRDATPALADLATLSAALPDAPAGSLRQAAAHAATGCWPAAAATLYTPVAEDDDQDEEPEASAPAASGQSPDEKRLRDLPGKVVRVTYLREYHVRDETAVLQAAMALGWEPAPASALPEDDPRDLVGAVMTLTENEGIPGADTLQEQTAGQLLRVERGDEVADWSSTPIIETFDHGWRLQSEPTPGTGQPDLDDPELPDMAVLFPVKTCACGGQDLECEECDFQLTPRTADLLHTALSILADEAYEDADQLGDRALAAGQHGGDWEVFTRLPQLTWRCGRDWRRNMARAFDNLAEDLEHGRWPQPTCTAEEMALHLALEEAPGHLDEVDDNEDHRHRQLPVHNDDYDWDACADVLFQDGDVVMLFNPAFDGIEDPDNDVNQAAGIGDLRPDAWFEPFHNVPARDPERGHRR